VSIVLMFKVNERFDVSATWVYGTGKARTLAVSRYAAADIDFNNAGEYWNNWYPIYEGYRYDEDVEYFKGKNAYREPAYHRLDIGLNWHNRREWGITTWSLGLYNAYNRQNPFYLFFGFDNYGNRALKQMSIFMLIPSISYSVEF
jgi:hypothetical protein